MTYQEIGADPRALEGKKFEVEELGLGFAKYENGLTLDILESWAIHMDNIGDSFVVGTKGGLRLLYQLEYQDQVLNEFGQRTDHRAEIRFDENEEINRTIDPNLFYNVNDQAHWIAYLSGQIPESLVGTSNYAGQRGDFPLWKAGQRGYCGRN